MRNANGTFQKGVSGNPSGRPAVVAQVQEIARRHTAEAMDTLIGLMNSPGTPPAVRLAAANAVLDRGYGRPTTAVRMETRDADLSSDERDAMLASLTEILDEFVRRERVDG